MDCGRFRRLVFPCGDGLERGARGLRPQRHDRVRGFRRWRRQCRVEQRVAAGARRRSVRGSRGRRIRWWLAVFDFDELEAAATTVWLSCWLAASATSWSMTMVRGVVPNRLVDLDGTGDELVAVSVECRVDERIEERVTGCDEVGDRCAFLGLEFFFEGDAFVGA